MEPWPKPEYHLSAPASTMHGGLVGCNYCSVWISAPRNKFWPYGLPEPK